MEKIDYRAELSFCCSPLVLDRLDVLVAKHRLRSRGELMREIVENYLCKGNIDKAVIELIYQHHDMLKTLGRRKPRRRQMQDGAPVA